ncbi:MAG: hypothetical protein U5L72_20010 [Bacteroidales bacterium]|nr:hypothetical protein [Bacteroidales bacterium]
MKRKIFLTATIVLLLPLWVSSQTLDDALRYSKIFYRAPQGLTV